MGYIHFAFLGEESFWAAEASECANDQGKFWEYHDELFANQNGENQGAFAKDKLKQFAANIDLDTATFNQCLDSGKHTTLVQQEVSFGQQIGVRSTPTIVINGQPVMGAQPFETFEDIFTQLLEGE